MHNCSPKNELAEGIESVTSVKGLSELTDLSSSNTSTNQIKTSTSALSDDCVHMSSIGIDVHEALMVCYYHSVDPTTSVLTKELLETGTKKVDLEGLVDWILEKNPEIIVMESTGVYWFALYDLLEEAGLKSITYVVNPRDVKAVKGKKTDKIDADRLATIGRVSQLQNSFIPNKFIRTTRSLSRQAFTLNYARQRIINRMQKNLVKNGARFKQVFSKITGKAAQIILQGVFDRLSGDELWELINEHCDQIRADNKDIFDAVQFINQDPYLLDIIKGDNDLIKMHDRQINDIYATIDELIRPFNDLRLRLQSIPGVSDKIARVMICELGDDWSQFTNAHRLAAWAGLAPGNTESAGKSLNSRTTKGNRFIRSLLVQAGNAISRKKSGGSYEIFQSLKERRGHNRAVMATAHRIIRIMFAIVRDGSSYQDSGVGTLTTQRVKRAMRDVKSISESGFNAELKIENSSTGETIVATKVRARPVQSFSSNESHSGRNHIHYMQVTKGGQSYCIDHNKRLFDVLVEGKDAPSTSTLLKHFDEQLSQSKSADEESRPPREELPSLEPELDKPQDTL